MNRIKIFILKFNKNFSGKVDNVYLIMYYLIKKTICIMTKNFSSKSTNIQAHLSVYLKTKNPLLVAS